MPPDRTCSTRVSPRETQIDNTRHQCCSLSLQARQFLACILSGHPSRRTCTRASASTWRDNPPSLRRKCVSPYHRRSGWHDISNLKICCQWINFIGEWPTSVDKKSIAPLTHLLLWRCWRRSRPDDGRRTRGFEPARHQCTYVCAWERVLVIWFRLRKHRGVV